MLSAATQRSQDEQCRGAATFESQLSIVCRMADELQRPAARYEDIAGRFEDHVSRIAPAMSWLLDQLQNDPSLAAQATDFATGIAAMARATAEGIGRINQWKEQLQGFGKIARPLGSPARRISAALDRIAQSSQAIVGWGTRVEHIRAKG
jgi:hypothetical protein